MSPSPSEHFGWPAFYEAAEQGRDLIAERETERRAWEARERERRRQQIYQAQAERKLSELRASGLLRSDRLSYTNICELEWITEVRSGSWSDF